MADPTLTYGDNADVTLNIQALLSEFDNATNQTQYENITMQFFSRYVNITQLIKATGDNVTVYGDLLFGYAAIRAYATYKDSRFLSAAQNAWDMARRYTLLQEDITSGKKVLELDYEHIQFTCNGASMAGGTTSIGYGNVFGGWEAVLFLRLSALLFEAISNDTYLIAAKQSADFIQAHLFQPPGLICEYISTDCSKSCDFPHDFYSDTAFIWMQGLSILSSITANSSMLSLVEQGMTTVTKQAGVWQKDDGVQIMSDSDGRRILNNEWNIQGLRGVYGRATFSSNLRNYMKSYLSVQYNAVLDLAREGNSDVYVGDWSGPASLQPPDIWNQTAASEVLVAGIALDSNSNVTPTSPEPELPSNPTTESTPTGAVVGGVVGGIAFIAGLTIMLWIFLFRRRRQTAPLTPFNSEYDGQGQEMLSAAVSHELKSQGVVSSQQEQRPRSSTPSPEVDNIQQRNSVPIQDMVRVLYERFQEPPPSYHHNPSVQS